MASRALVLFLGLSSAALLHTSCGGCGGGDAKGCIERGEAYAFGSVLGENHVKAFQLFQSVCNSGNEKGCDDLLWMCLENKCAPEESANVAQIFQAACARGAVKRCTSLGVMYARGMGVQEDDAKAAQLFQKACDGGNARGCGHLGARYASQSLGEMLVCGRSCAVMRALTEPYEFTFAYVCPDQVPASHCGRVIIERENHGQIPSGSCTTCSFILGQRYAPVREDDAKAFQLYERACDGGDGLGCLNLSNMYRNGMGVRKDAAKAALLGTRGFALIKSPEPPY